MAEESYGLQDYSDDQPVLSVDPVCGLEVAENDCAGNVGYKGQLFYFCSENCKKTFEEDPEKYILLAP